MMKMHRVNKVGLEMIRQELLSRCKPSVFNGWLDDDLVHSKESQDMLLAWASELEDVLDADNGDSIEVKQFYTKSGHVEDLSISDSGIDVTFEEIE